MEDPMVGRLPGSQGEIIGDLKDIKKKKGSKIWESGQVFFFLSFRGVWASFGYKK